MAERRLWTRDEVKQALALYLVTDFGRLHSRNPSIIRLAAQLGRTPSSVALKCVNLAALDDSLPRRGMANASAVDREVWAGFLQRPEGVAAFMPASDPARPSFSEAAEAAAPFDHLAGGGERMAETRQRIGQDAFRRIVLTSYGHRCALTGADDPRLLTASHILPWAESVAHRMLPSNGICLNALHDRAFDRHLITFDADWRMQIAPDVPRTAAELLARDVRGPLSMPARFLPSAELMQQHRARFVARLA